MSESPLPPGPEASDGRPASSGRASARGWLWFLLVAVIAFGGWYFYDRHQSATLAEKK
jgi:hypothetical protein